PFETAAERPPQDEGNFCLPSTAFLMLRSAPGGFVSKHARTRCSPLVAPRPMLRELLQNLVDREARSLLARRIIHKGPEEFSDEPLRRHQQVGVLDQPIIVG